MSAPLRGKLLVASAALAVPLVFAATATPAHAAAPVHVNLHPLKGSHATGTATLTATADGSLRVHIHTTGMVANSPHAQHIHGDTSGRDFFWPPASADKNDNGFTSVEEGLPMYGNIDISLTTKGDTSPKSGLAVDRMPVANDQGVLDYTRTIPASALPKGTIANLTKLHIVQHGVDANGNGKYDLKGLGESSFAKSMGAKGIPEEATDGADCGMIMPAAPDIAAEPAAALSAPSPVGRSTRSTAGPFPSHSASSTHPGAAALGESAPTRVTIPAIGVDASLVRLGLKADGEMETPDADPDQAGWFEGAHTPGGPGTSVVVGHVTWNREPTVFDRLGQLERGDRITVARQDGSSATFGREPALHVC